MPTDNPALTALRRACAEGTPIYTIPARRYFVTDAWVGVGGHLRRYQVSGPEGFVSLHKTLGEAVAKADAMESES
jgi:hypothetical protein